MVFSVVTRLGNHQYHLIQNPRRNLVPISCHPQPQTSGPSHWKPLTYLLSLWICLFWSFHISGIIQYVIDWLLLLSTVFKFHPSYRVYFIPFCSQISHCMDIPHFVLSTQQLVMTPTPYCSVMVAPSSLSLMLLLASLLVISISR